jgi:hypothetical protein
MKTFALVLSLATVALASEALPPAMYEITTETGMPHLEENLRYSTTHERRCLGAAEPLTTAFPILSHVSLKGCRLDHESRQGHTVSYLLACEGAHGTTGHATWELGRHGIIGTLHVKLGGKNMTFYQRVTAVPVGQCEVGSP